MLLLGKFDDLADMAGECGANAIQHEAVISLDLVLVIVINDLILYSGTLGKLISADLVFCKCCV